MLRDEQEDAWNCDRAFPTKKNFITQNNVHVNAIMYLYVAVDMLQPTHATVRLLPPSQLNWTNGV
jgi:hypothetical protein